ncbi:protein of unknown function (plasmid) [Cupriavidus taiwanensis]|uniref:Uncharacterized protein n=1 Tax=Cupriavidus taiwanensis TaxID=164546 RepID=A0A7Z7JAS5_9BURK|nr:protein of unknown function [Cupriavidus taiwanensis]SOZ10937.1 protein of unknown function [Cupriavidus taiwanensis]SOZ42262.1 protein of unknown function [Cupriavidus taiwanensis]SPC21301.1 protein of unknown function [Cupriavidus taiwanensis]SPD55442.1 protein of unknown function [Cupriavidus taiwanensis]
MAVELSVAAGRDRADVRLPGPDHLHAQLHPALRAAAGSVAGGHAWLRPGCRLPRRHGVFDTERLESETTRHECGDAQAPDPYLCRRRRFRLDRMPDADHRPSASRRGL